MKILTIVTIILNCLVIGNAFGQGPNLIKNGSFLKSPEGVLEHWKLYNVDGKLSLDSEYGLSLTVNSTGKVGSIAQTIKGVPPERRFVFEAMVKSTVPGMAYLQVKLKQGKKVTLKRLDSSGSTLEWSKLRVEFSSELADTLSLQCRYNRKIETLDQTFYIKDAVFYDVSE